MADYYSGESMDALLALATAPLSGPVLLQETASRIAAVGRSAHALLREHLHLGADAPPWLTAQQLRDDCVLAQRTSARLYELARIRCGGADMTNTQLANASRSARIARGRGSAAGP